jgi:transcriptional regulator with XRE-family HTH domain
VETLAEYRELDMLRGITTPTDRAEMTSLPDAIRACRKGRLTQDELASKAGVGQSTLSQWETGKTVPDVFQLRAIEVACDREAGWIGVRAGLFAVPQTVAEAIAMDPDLEDGERVVVLDVYRGFTDPRK